MFLYQVVQHPSAVLLGYMASAPGYLCTAAAYAEGGYEPIGSWRYVNEIESGSSEQLDGAKVERALNRHFDTLAKDLQGHQEHI